MGADPFAKDIFIEVGAMWAPAQTTYGSDSAPWRCGREQAPDGGGTRIRPSFEKAFCKQILAFAATAVGFSASDTLSVRVSVTLSNSSPGGSNASGAIRLWYNVPSQKGSTSHLHARRGTTDVKYYLIKPFKLQRDGVVLGPTQDVAAVVYKTAFTELRLRQGYGGPP